MERKEKKLAEGLRSVLQYPGLPSPRYAVVIPLVPTEEGIDVLVEVRAAGISQAGDPCFPGGHIEAGETPVAAAARELREELGIWVPPEEFLGQLPTVQTMLGSRTDVFVCIVPPKLAEQIQIEPAEVAELMQVPLSLFLRHPQAPSYTIGKNCIWGMTAGAIHQLCRAWNRAEAQS